MTDLPTDEQRQRAKWDLLLLNLEQRAEQVRQLKTYEPQHLDLLLLEIQHHTKQLRQLKNYEPRWLILSSLTIGAAIFGVGIAFGHWGLG